MRVSQRYVLSCVVALFACMMCLCDASAQPGGGGFGGFGGFGGRPEDLLRRDDVRKELELVDDQIKQLDELSARQREGGRDLFSGFQDLSREERGEKMREILAERAAETQKELDNILLPNQAERLAQLSVQFSMRGGASRALSGNQVAEELGITDEQKENIRKKSEELQKELNEKIAELRKEMQDEVMQELTAKQRAQWEEMVGDPFEFQQTQQFGGGNFGGGGGRQFGNRGGGGNRQRPEAE